jgi:hypothetical protein
MKITRLPVPAPSAPEVRATFSHEEIARRAEALWREKGCPPGCDAEIWLEAERRMGEHRRQKRDERDEKAFANPRFLFNQGDGSMMDELNERFPGSTGRETTSL